MDNSDLNTSDEKTKWNYTNSSYGDYYSLSDDAEELNKIMEDQNQRGSSFSQTNGAINSRTSVSKTNYVNCEINIDVPSDVLRRNEIEEDAYANDHWYDSKNYYSFNGNEDNAIPNISERSSAVCLRVSDGIANVMNCADSGVVLIQKQKEVEDLLGEMRRRSKPHV